MSPLESNPIKILVVDDHPMVRAGLRNMLQTDPDLVVVGEAETAADAVTQADTLQPEVILLDYGLPDTDGITALQQLKVVNPRAHVIIVTMHENAEYIRQAMQAGATGYILKGVRRHQLIDAIRRVVKDQSTQIPFLFNQTSPASNIAKPKIVQNSKPVPQLRPVEYKMLCLLAEGCNNKEIGEQMKWSLSTVKKYLQRLYQTLEVSDRTQAVATAIRAGLIQ